MAEKLSKGLTVVVPVYNRASIVGRMLHSIEKQTLRPLSVILVDNGSSDGTIDELRKWQLRVGKDLDVNIISETTPGAAAARNAGLRLVKTDWTMFFDSDDEMATDHCERAMSDVEGYDIVGWDTEHITTDGSRHIKPFYVEDAQYHNLMHGSFATQRYMARTELFRNAGGWDKDVRYWDDIELGARLLTKHPRMKKNDGAPRVFVYENENSISGTLYSNRPEGAALALARMEATLGPDRQIWVKLKHAIFAADCTREGSDEGKRVLCQLLNNEKTLRGRLLIRGIYIYRRLGGRGGARLVRFMI
ncbi:MAG: glycosyltransferase family 2 protein [Muribaculaceae bacterium]|nr:glycosyltransferase family 2 protein [Muribaculaceae bacterium]